MFVLYVALAVLVLFVGLLLLHILLNDGPLYAGLFLVVLFAVLYL